MRRDVTQVLWKALCIFPVTVVSFARSSFWYLRFLISKTGVMTVLDLMSLEWAVIHVDSECSALTLIFHDFSHVLYSFWDSHLLVCWCYRGSICLVLITESLMGVKMRIKCFSLGYHGSQGCIYTRTSLKQSHECAWDWGRSVQECELCMNMHT